MELTFDPEKHIYRLDGVALPSVTQVMKPLSREKYDSIDSATLNAAAKRGTGVHEAIEFFVQYGVEDCTEEGRGYFDAFLKWAKAEKPTFEHVELATWHSVLMYAGTADMIATIAGRRLLIDVKTTAALNDMLTSVQLEAYERALETQGFNLDGKAILHLKKDGSYKFKLYANHDLEAWNTFAALLTVRAHIKKYGG